MKNEGSFSATMDTGVLDVIEVVLEGSEFEGQPTDDDYGNTQTTSVRLLI